MNFDTTSPWGTWKVHGSAALILGLIDKMPVSTISRKLALLLRKPVKASAQEVFDRDIWGLRMRLGTRGNLTEQRWLTMPSFHDTHEHAGNAGQSSVRTVGSGRRVQGRPLLDILLESGVSSVDAMKIDIEGFEVPVIEAFYNTAPRTLWPRCVIAEIVGKDGESLKNLLVSRNYKIAHCTKMNGILVLAA